MEQGLFEYDPETFIQASNEALDVWRQNDMYDNRLDRVGAPAEVNSFDDLTSLPTIDMREFKQHPEDLVIDPDEAKTEYALFSSGTTADSKSLAKYSETGLKRQKTLARGSLSPVFHNLDFVALLTPGRETLEQLPLEKSRRAVFRYALWMFETYENEHFLNLSGGEFHIRVEALVDELQTRDGDLAIFSPPRSLFNIMKEMKRQEITIDMGDAGTVVTAGGWKGDAEGSKGEFRGLIGDVFGVPPQGHVDMYGCTELMVGACNRFGDDDPDLKRPNSRAYFWVADEDEFRRSGTLEPVGDGEAGLMVGVDPCNPDYPGVILTDDVVRKTGGEYAEDTRIEYVGRSTR